MMTGGDSRLNNRTTSDLLLEFRRRKEAPMLDKAVQFNSYYNDSEDMMMMSTDESGSAFESARDVSGGGGGDGGGVTVAEINSPVEQGREQERKREQEQEQEYPRSNGPSTPIYSRPFHRTNESQDSGVDDTNDVLCPDNVDAATLVLRPKHFTGSQKVDNDAADEIKEQSFSVVGNSLYNDGKIKELSESKEDNSCALECLAFTLECCQCVIL